MREIYFQTAVNYDDALWLAAAESGVDSSYWDIFGRQHHASRETLHAILTARGWKASTSDEIEAERKSRFEGALECGLSKTYVVSENAKVLAVSTRLGEHGSLGYELVLEGGERLTGSVEIAALKQSARASSGNRSWQVFELILPAETPLGYHR